MTRWTTDADDYDQEQFTGGRCHILALTLHHLYGLPIKAVANKNKYPGAPGDGQDSLAYSVTHYVVETPDGLFWDATGSFDKAGLFREYANSDEDIAAGTIFLQEQSPEEMMAYCARQGWIAVSLDEVHEAKVFIRIYLDCYMRQLYSLTASRTGITINEPL